MKWVQYKDDYIVHLTYEEEQTLAEWTMDLLSQVWFDKMCGEVFRRVSRLYQYKCEIGGDFLLMEDYLPLVEAVEKWNESYERQIDLGALPIVEDGKERMPPTKTDSGKKFTRDEKLKWMKRNTRQAWREVWLHHRIKGTDDAFLVFPGDDPAESYDLVQVERERRFWNEVERRAKEWGDPARGISRSEVIKAVSDYMPRGDFHMPDPKNEGHESLMDRMEVEYPDPD